MDDIELATGASPAIGRLYTDAKTFRSDAPILALTYLRGLAGAFCDSLDRDLKDQNLNEKIAYISRQGFINQRYLRLLRVLQSNGNKGAHPESFDFLTLDLRALADQSMSAALALIEHLYVLRGGETPVYEVIPVESGALKAMCVGAMLDRDVEAMDQAGQYFHELADSESKLGVPLAGDGYPALSRANIDQAMFWYKQAAAENHPNAMYQYGHYLTQHYKVSKERLSEGERYIARASQAKHADALVYVGEASLNGSGLFAKDEVYAREVFMDAARQGHPVAWAQLGAMHSLGVGGTADPIAAALYTLEAARAGIPQAQFNLFVMYMNGSGLPKDEAEAVKCLQEAAAQDHPKAIYNLATFIEQGKIPSRPLEDAEAEYLRVVHHPEFGSRAALYAAQMIEKRATGMPDWIRAARHLQACYSAITAAGDPHKLNAECLSACSSVVGKIREELNKFGPDHALNADDIFTSALFDQEYVPVLDAAARIYELSDAIAGFGFSTADAQTKYLIREASLKPRSVKPARPVTLPAQRLILPSNTPTIGRNDACHCGSGKKFKKCHGGGTA